MSEIEKIGDNAKMREALLEARRFVFAAKQGQRDILVNKNSDPHVIKAKDALAKIDAALAAPPRNCDRFGTIKQAKAEWWKTEVLPRVEGVVGGAEPPFEEWLLLPATGQKGENDGSK